MKLISWNVNGFRACLTKGFADFFHETDADFFCIQETKMQPGQAEFETPGYHQYWYSAEKKGYSGTIVYSKLEPISVEYGIYGKYNDEGRVITLEFDKFYFVCAYVPNSQEELKRLDYRMCFEDDMRNYLQDLASKKSVIYTGDLNVAHKEIDIKNPKANEKNAGYSIQERDKFTELLNAGFIDSFRYLNPEKIEYSWWSYRFNSRAKNVGWRLDYFVVSKNLKDVINNSSIKTDVLGSDHAPIVLDIEL